MKVVAAFAALLALAYSTAVPEHHDLKNYVDQFEDTPSSPNEFSQKQLEEDAKLLVPAIIEKYGYPCEVHTVQTSQGYILEMHRIPYGRKGPSKSKGVVYLQHGILSSSADWILAGIDNALAYILADAGYDVWMPNVRGTKYSRKHVSFHPDKDADKFWDFSWHDIALDDLPAMIDYVTIETKQEKMFYIGHSQGTTVFFVLCAEKPEYNNRFRAMFALAPIAYMKWMTSPLMRIIALADWGVAIFFEMVGMHEFLPSSGFLAQLGDIFCSDGSIFQILCTNSLFAVCGFNPDQMNATLLPVIMGHTPAGAATKQFLHFAQEVNSGKFRKYDYGMMKNIKHYGSMTPPSYKLRKVTAPVYLHYSRNDWLSNPRDVDKLYNQLGNVKGKFLSPDNKFNHADYLYGMDAPALLYSRVLGLMKRH